MFDNINFRRFDKKSNQEYFEYTQQANSSDVQNNPSVISMDGPGFHMSVHVSNYMAEPIMLAANAQSSATKITSLQRDIIRARHDEQNSVVIKIYTSENPAVVGNRKQVTQIRKTEIRIPGYMLNQGSVFVEELDCYLTTESNLDATRELIAREAVEGRKVGESINIPANMVSPKPTTLYMEYKDLIKACMARQDKIQVRVGFDIRYGKIPDVIKNFHIAILDLYFVPFDNNRLVFDPSLGEDEFVIENLHYASQEQYRSTFNDLNESGSLHIDINERETLSGTFYGLVLFANREIFENYYWARRTSDRFREEQLYVAERSGNPLLAEKLVASEKRITQLEENQAQLEADNNSLRKQKSVLSSDLADRERTITRLQNSHDKKLSEEAVLLSMETERLRAFNDGAKATNDAHDQKFRSENLKMSQRATVLKNVSEIMKSGWGIITGCVAGVLAVMAVLRKFNVKLTMG